MNLKYTPFFLLFKCSLVLIVINFHNTKVKYLNENYLNHLKIKKVNSNLNFFIQKINKTNRVIASYQQKPNLLGARYVILLKSCLCKHFSLHTCDGLEF